ncbi:DLW-39 family protein [Pseudonocardia bannensis]|nr:DLW-39 family protein [Pseudonocardia bannensis]
MKKLLALAAAAGAAFLVLSKVCASRSESDLWHEATTR